VDKDVTMDSWTALTCGLVAGAGALLFLRVVADRILYGEGMLKRLETREKTSQKRRFQAARDAKVIEAELAGREHAA
jgi:hypothetical protein